MSRRPLRMCSTTYAGKSLSRTCRAGTCATKRASCLADVARAENTGLHRRRNSSAASAPYSGGPRGRSSTATNDTLSMHIARHKGDVCNDLSGALDP